MSAQNLTLLTDLYELTMMQGYFESQANETVIFDVFFRENPNKGGYSVMAGLEQVIEYIKNLNFSYEDVDYLRGLGLFSEDFLHYLSGFHFSGDIYAIPEGSVIFPREPLVKVIAPIMEAQVVETAVQRERQRAVRITGEGDVVDQLLADALEAAGAGEVQPRLGIGDADVDGHRRGRRAGHGRCRRRCRCGY